MTTVELLAYCRSRKHEPYIPDLVWQQEMHRGENLQALCDEEASYTPNGYHDMYEIILEHRSWLLTTGRTYATILFMGSAACSKPQK